MDKLKKKITQAFKLSGYVIRSENSAFLAEQLLPFDTSEHEKWLNTVIENIQNLKLDSANIDRTVIEKAIGEINRVGLRDDETVFSVIDAFDIPRFVYNTLNKKFELDKTPRSMLSNPAMQSGYLRQRYNMLYQKTIRHELFSPSILKKSAGEETKKFKLLHAENLLASTEVKEAVILGQLSQIEEGKFFIEDLTGYVQVDLSAARFHSGFFCEGCFVLAEGSYENGILKVDGLGFPPAEPATSSRAFFGTANSWGGPSEKLLKYSVALQEVERTNTEATMVFLADVELDIPQVIDKLRKLFVGYDSCPPVCIVLMGPFSTTTHNFYDLVPLFKKLAEAANGCDQLKKETDLIIVPHADDPISSDIFPRLPIPDVICADLLKAWPRTKLVSNPCRLQYCTQQIVVFRLDLMARLARNTIHFPDTKTIDNHFARTLICQGHLTPFDRYVNPIYWDYDTSMWLYPLPDLVVIGDTCQSFSITQHGCTILNTGSFPRSNFAFKMYIPSLKTVEDSEIPEGFGEDGYEMQEEEVVEIPEREEEVDPANRIIPNTGITGNFLKYVKERGAADDSEMPSVSGLSRSAAKSLVDDAEMPSVSGQGSGAAGITAGDSDIPSVSWLSGVAAKTIVQDSEIKSVSWLNSVATKSIVDDSEIPGVSGLSGEVAKRIADDFEMPSVSGLGSGAAKTIVDDLEMPSVYGLSSEAAKRIVDDLEIPSVSGLKSGVTDDIFDDDDDDTELPTVSGFRRGEGSQPVPLDSDDEETNRLIAQLELPSDSDSSD